MFLKNIAVGTNEHIDKIGYAIRTEKYKVSQVTPFFAEKHNHKISRKILEVWF